MNTIFGFPKTKTLLWLIAFLSALLIAGCGSGSGGAPSGTLGVFLTDAPACGFNKVNITVNQVRVHENSTAEDTALGWHDITLNPAQKIDLLSLNNGTFFSLGQIPLPAGRYTQVRLVLNANANTAILAGSTTEIPLVTPSAVQTGIKLVNQFDVLAGQRADLMLDFNACQSIVKRGNGTLALKPVVRVIPFALNGIDGFVDAALLNNNVVVTAQQNGVIVQTTAPNAATGEFFLSRLAPGNYDVVITADGRITEIITGVPIASTTSVVNVSDSNAPITLPVSTTHIASGAASLNPISTTEVAFVAAKQTLGTAPTTVTVKFVAADDASTPSGAYALNLPVDAPLLGQFTSTLPIAMTAQSGVAAQYTLEATANGYQTQSINVDVSAADLVQDFVLGP
ncbi:MAG: DUF4382 domain-containing protein [Sideroxyarcus sp.]|nr:DUF4382 domain-containing protein [Sideroxyarcus sp.]